MRIGVVFPQTEIGGDVGAVRAYAERVDELGFAHVLAYDHVLGADPDVHPAWTGPYDVDTTFHEPFVLFGYLAAVTALELVTGVIILPQRQTALVAKQAAEVDLLTAGRFRLGVGVGWNAVEYEALGKDFSDRGRRLDGADRAAAAPVDRSEPSRTTATVRAVTGAGLAPLPVQRPIPMWIGGESARGLPPGRPAGRRLVPAGAARSEARRGPAIISRAAAEAGRDPDVDRAWRAGSAGAADGVDRVVETGREWRDAGATHIAVNTMGAGLGSPDDHLAAFGAGRGRARTARFLIRPLGVRRAAPRRHRSRARGVYRRRAGGRRRRAGDRRARRRTRAAAARPGGARASGRATSPAG